MPDENDKMSDVQLGALIVIVILGLILFGPFIVIGLLVVAVFGLPGLLVCLLVGGGSFLTAKSIHSAINSDGTPTPNHLDNMPDYWVDIASRLDDDDSGIT